MLHYYYVLFYLLQSIPVELLRFPDTGLEGGVGSGHPGLLPVLISEDIVHFSDFGLLDPILLPDGSQKFLEIIADSGGGLGLFVAIDEMEFKLFEELFEVGLCGCGCFHVLIISLGYIP